MWIVLGVLSIIIASSAGEECHERYYNAYYGYQTRVIHCNFGCCGTYYDQYCCVSNAGFIVGMVFAGIFVVSVTAAVICCCMKHKTTRGRVVQPSTVSGPPPPTTHNAVFIVPSVPIAPPSYSGPSQPPQYNPSYQPMPGYPSTGPLPPAYSKNAPPPPPAYTYNNHAFIPSAPDGPPQQTPFAAAVATSAGPQTS